MTTVVERMFHVESAAERTTWLEAIEGVKRRLEEVKDPATSNAGNEEEMREHDDDDPFETIFAKRGEVQKKSGSKKVVSDNSTHFFIYNIQYALIALQVPKWCGSVLIKLLI